MDDKPLTLKRKDFIVSVTDLVANSGLPAFVMADIFNVLYSELADLARRQESIDFNNYMEEIKNGNNKAKRPGDGEEGNETGSSGEEGK